MPVVVKIPVGRRNEAVRGKLDEFCKKYQDMSVEEKSDLVLMCRVERTYKSETSRLVFSIERSGARQFVLSSLVQLGAIRKQGRAPKGALERELEEWLGTLTED